MCNREREYVVGNDFYLCSQCGEAPGMAEHKSPSKIQIKSEPETNKLYLDLSDMDREALEKCASSFFGERDFSINKIISKTIGSYSMNGVPKVEKLGETQYCLDFSKLNCAYRIDWGLLESLVNPENVFLSALRQSLHYIREIEGGMRKPSVD